MCQFGNAVTVEVLPPYIPSQAEKDDPALYAANIRKLIVSDTCQSIQLIGVAAMLVVNFEGNASGLQTHSAEASDSAFALPVALDRLDRD